MMLCFLEKYEELFDYTSKDEKDLATTRKEISFPCCFLRFFIVPLFPYEQDKKEKQMKKALSLLTTGLFVASIFFIFPSAAGADVDRCYDDHQRCWERAIRSNAGAFKTAIMLTVCDGALGICLIAYSIR